MRLPSLGSPFSGFWPGLGCALLVWGASLLGWTANLEGIALDAMFRARGPRDADPRVVIVAVDDAAVVRAGERTGAGWPLPRSYYGRAIRDLKRLGAKTIAFDVLFSEPGPDARQDLELARQCRAVGNIAQACAFQVPAQRVELSPNLPAAPLPARFALVSPTQQLPVVRRAVWATAPLPALSESAAALGHVNVFPEASGVLRRAPHLLRWHGQMFPSLSLATAAHFLGEKPTLDSQTSQIILAGRHIPLDREGLTLVNWIGAGEAYPKWSLNQLLDGQIPEAAIRGRVVIVGVTALGAFESRATPFAGGIAAVDFQANALDDILSNRLLKTVAAPISTLLLLGFPILCAHLTARRGGKSGWPIPVLMGLLLFSGWFGLRHDFYWPVATPLLGGALAFGLTSALGYRREWESLARFDAAASSLARGTTLLGAALGTSTRGTSARDETQLADIIRTTALETLDAREVFLITDDQIGDARALIAARIVQEKGQSWIFPISKNQEVLGDETLILRGQTLVAAPLQRSQTPENPTSDRQFCGALVAIGTRDGAAFSARDATLLETLAEGAALALENFRYSNALRGRIASADRELEGAYRLLAEQSAKLFAAVESIDAALVVSDARGNAAFVNAPAARILRDATPHLGQRVAQALSEGELEDFARCFESLSIQNADSNSTSGVGLDSVHLESIHLETARDSQLLAAQFTPLWSEENGFLGAMLVVSDVTAQRELERMKTDFVGFVAHELRTPLSTILGYTSLLETMAGRFSPEETRDMTQTISRHCRRMNAMISDLLDISRLESGAPLPIRRENFDVAALCTRLIDEQKTYLNPTPPRQIEMDCDMHPLFFAGDADRIEQVVLNLLSNAVKYSPEGGKITLWLQKTATGIELSVSDEGLGLSRAQMDKLFGKFYRTEDSQARGIKGNGLGLNLVKQIVEAHGGTIAVSSRRDEGEKGATFRVVLPDE